MLECRVLVISAINMKRAAVEAFASKLPRTFLGDPTAAAGASSGAAERTSWHSGEATAIAPGRGDCQRSRGHGATLPPAAGRRREGRKGDPPGRRIRGWEGEGEEVGVEMSRSMFVGGEDQRSPGPGEQDGLQQLLVLEQRSWTRRG
uniref:Uncharacterized protein n=1 Tax=Arundo donax TaxID=35708 RepID=A0A0A9E2G3_ARUDO